MNDFWKDCLAVFIAIPILVVLFLVLFFFLLIPDVEDIGNITAVYKSPTGSIKLKL